VNDSLTAVSAFEWTPAGLAPLDRLLEQLEQHRAAGQRVVTTNGCFDLLHAGHVRFLGEARALGDVLIVGLNSDASVRRLKGPGRPIVSETGRAAMLAALRPVDHVVVFDDLLPNDLLALIRPDVHCKAADYTADALPEAEVVRRNGGEVCILPLSGDNSTSQLIERVIAISQTPAATERVDRYCGNERTQVIEQLLVGASVLRQTAYRLSEQVVLAATMIARALGAGGKVLLCGNGGSAADAQHIAGELVGRFRRERGSWPAIALTTDTSILTAVGNDYGFEHVFARQVTALGQPGDILIAISTSGASRNVLAAVEVARGQGVYVIGLTGGGPSPLANAADLCLGVPTEDTAFIQQAHIAMLHAVCDLVEQMLVEEKKGGRPSSRVSGP
jgi:D-sedoheptulose 7-phosphate isomerase